MNKLVILVLEFQFLDGAGTWHEFLPLYSGEQWEQFANQWQRENAANWNRQIGQPKALNSYPYCLSQANLFLYDVQQGGEISKTADRVEISSVL